MKKFASLVSAGAMLLSVAAPTFAFGEGWFDFLTDEATVKNYAKVKNEVETKSLTGFNEIHGKYVFGGKIKTGDAWALSGVTNTVNTNSLDCGCYDDLYIKNKAKVKNDVETKAITGFNEIGGYKVFGGLIKTGDAGAESYVDNVVNTNLVGSEVE